MEKQTSVSKGEKFFFALANLGNIPIMTIITTFLLLYYASMKTTMAYTAPIFGYYSVSSMAEIARILGKQDDHEHYADLSSKIAEAIGRGVINQNGDMPVEFMGAYVLPLFFDLVPERHRQHFAEKLVDMIESNGNCLDTGFLGTPFLLDALCKIGRQDKAYQLLYQTKCPSWLYEVEHGATTIWESWYGYQEDGNPIPISMNHYAFGCVDDWMFRTINGINSLRPGFKGIRIQPQADDSLQFARRTYHTPYGDVRCDWKKEQGKFHLEVELPCNTVAQIVMPNGDTHEVGSGAYVYEQPLA